MPERLLEGFKNFRHEAYEGANSLMQRLVRDGQSPDYFIISCIDSRGNPGTIFKPDPGTFFAHKAMGAIVRPYKQGTALAAALHFALNYNEVRTIIILGHTGCGAVKALVDGLKDEEISSFVQVAQTALEKAKSLTAADDTHDNIFRHAEEQIVLESMENLKSYPSVAKALSEKRITIKPWLFDMHSGEILEYSPEAREFKTITGSSPGEIENKGHKNNQTHICTGHS